MILWMEAVQAQYNDSKIKFSNAYYDTLGLERPDGTESESQMVAFEAVSFCFVKKEE